jgi:hypothetical protein
VAGQLITSIIQSYSLCKYDGPLTSELKINAKSIKLSQTNDDKTKAIKELQRMI